MAWTNERHFSRRSFIVFQFLQLCIDGLVMDCEVIAISMLKDSV